MKSLTAPERFATLAVVAVLLLAFHLLYGPFFAATREGIGNDYSYFLPALLDSYYWTLNNSLRSIQWFTPAFCGGLPAFPNPQNAAFTLPYWLNLRFNPLASVYLTVLVCAAVGFSGFYVLQRHSFATSAAVAVSGAALFMFNGFFVHRMLVGHFALHAFMLTPLIACFLLRPTAAGRWRSATDCSIAGGLLAYVIYAGGSSLLPVMLLSVMLIGVIHGVVNGHGQSFWGKLLGAGALAAGLSAAKLAPMLVYLDAFPRDYLPVAGFTDLPGMLATLGRALFWIPPDEPGAYLQSSTEWWIQRHELEYGVTAMPLILLVAWLAHALHTGSTGRLRAWVAVRQLNLIIALLLALVPVALNLAAGAWASLVKSLPVIGSMSVMPRWFSVYVPVVILLGCLAFERTAWFRNVRPYIAVAAIVMMLLFNISVDRSYYAGQSYDPRPVANAYEQVRGSGRAPPITGIVASMDNRGIITATIDRNDALVRGESQWLCYEPILGYRLEKLPQWPLRPGPVDTVREGLLNLKNPACYVFGQANRCRPGDHFTASQAAAAQAFARYETFEFERPRWQRVAIAVTFASSALVLGLWVAAAWAILRRPRQRAAI